MGEVVVPVGLPDEGCYDWLDMFHQKNPGYTEISNRAILDWARQSGISTNRMQPTNNDAPEVGSNIADLDKGQVYRYIKTLAPVHGRNYIIQDVRANLLKQ